MKQILESLLGGLGMVWAWPMCLAAWVFTLILILTDQVDHIFPGPYLTYVVDLKNDARFCRRQMLAKGWAGYALGNAVYVVDVGFDRWERTVKHERAHVFQQYVFGVFWLPLYFLASIFIFLFVRRLHSYYDNPFERHARKAAGQQQDIPKSQWSDGPNDRWAWW